jgi:hypothetical protein
MPDPASRVASVRRKSWADGLSEVHVSIARTSSVPELLALATARKAFPNRIIATDNA